MALAIAVERRPQPGPRRHQSTPPERHLTLVPQATRRTIRLFAAGAVGLFLLMSIAIGFQAVIAEQQLKLDHVSGELRLAKLYQDQLRQERAGLLAPEFLRTQAGLQGMAQGLGSRFVEVPQDVVAQVVIATALMDPTIAEPSAMSSFNPLAPLSTLRQEQVTP